MMTAPSKSTMLFLIVLICAVLSANVTNAAEYYVDHLDDSSTATACRHFVHPDCSLRGAIMKANANPGADVIQLVSDGTYTLTLSGSDEEGGDLDITDDLIIRGGHPESKVIDASGIHAGDRVFDIGPDITVEIHGVSITGGYESDGGGIYNTGVLILENVWLTNNWAFFSGGGVYNDSAGAILITKSIVASNRAHHYGAGVFNKHTFLTGDSEFVGNTADGEGGGIYNSADGSMEIHRSFFSNNVVLDTGAFSGLTYSGGAVHNLGYFAAYSCTFYQNQAPDGSGGAIASDGGQLRLYHLTLFDNHSPNGSAIHGNSGSDVALANSIVSGTCDLGLSPFTSLGGNIESPGHSCPLNPAVDATYIADPMLGDLGYNGGWSRSFPLLPGSLAIDFSDYSDGQWADQRGRSRPVDGDGDGDSRFDSGAYEYYRFEVFFDGFEIGSLDGWSSFVPSSY